MACACLGLVLATLASSSSAAEPKERQATELDGEGKRLFAAKKYDAAVAKFEKAIDVCGKQCPPSLVAKLNLDLGVVYVAGLEDTEEGRAAFIIALTADPRVSLSPELATGKVGEVFDEVKSAVVQVDASKKKEEAAKRAEELEGMIQEPPKEGAVLTPLPVWAELEPGNAAKRLKLSYRNAEGEWVSLNMKRMGGGYGLEIPCKGVGSVPRVLDYYIQGYDGSDVVAHSGSRNAPRQVAIKRKLDGPPPTLPGEEPPKECMDECPPGVEACAVHEGGECDSDDACSAGLACIQGTCSKPKVDPTAAMGKRLWFSLGLQLDWMMILKQNNICSGGNAYACYWGTGAYYDGMPSPEPGTNEISSTTIKAATKRVLLGVDYVLWTHFSVGGRVGVSFDRGPRGYSPLHLEARLAYWLRERSRDPGFYPYLAGSVGYAWMDGSHSVKVLERGSADFCNPPQSDQCVQKTLTAWRSSGPLLASLALGALYEIDPKLRKQLDPRLGIFLELKATQLLVNTGLDLGAQLGIAAGF